MTDNRYFYQRELHVCGFKPKQCLQAVAWIQLFASAIVVGTLVHIWITIDTEDGRSVLKDLLVAFYSPIVETAFQKGACRVSLAAIAFCSSAGLITGFILLDGVTRGNVINLRLWITHAVLFILVDIGVHTYMGWPSVSICLRMLISTGFYIFGIWAAICRMEELSLRYDPLSYTIPSNPWSLNNVKGTQAAGPSKISHALERIAVMD